MVTGGSSGIGQSVVANLRLNNHRVAVADIMEPIESDFFVQCNLCDIENLKEVVTNAYSGLDGIDALILNAAIYDALTIADCDLNAFEIAIRTNLHSPYALVKAWLEMRLSNGTSQSGTIILMTSAAAHIGSRDPGYSSSKSGLLGLSRSLALNLTDNGIRVFSVSPGVVDTPMSRAQGDTRRDSHLDRTLLRRSAEPEEIANIILWLLESAPAYMSGSDINVSSGLKW